MTPKIYSDKIGGMYYILIIEGNHAGEKRKKRHMLPYPGRNESYSSWDFRCRQYENRQAEWRREQASRATNWGGYNYRAVKTADGFRDGNSFPYKMPDGTMLEAVKVNSSYTRGWSIERFAVKNGLAFMRVTWGSGITSRTDNIAFRPTADMLATYDNDNH